MNQPDLFATVAPPGEYLEAWADIDTTGVYRYALGRVWDRSLPFALWLMCNPSKAAGVDGHGKAIDDPTLRRTVNYSRDFGYGGLVLVNMFGFRATNPAELLTATDPVGPENDEKIRYWLNKNPGIVIAAWGVNARKHKARAAAVVAMLADINVFCLGTSADGIPLHPLMLAGNLQPQKWAA